MDFETLEYFQLCHMAGVTIHDAKRFAITREELITILKQSKIE